MYKERVSPHIFIQQQTVDELAQAYTRDIHPANKQYEDSCNPAKTGAGKYWYGGITSIADATSILTTGWADGAARAMELKETLEAEVPKARSRKRRKVWSGEGDLDVDRAINGDWDTAYRTTMREEVVGSQVCVCLVAAWGGNCEKTAEQLFWSGACMLVLSDVLEGAGYSTRLDAVSKSRHHGNIALNIITMKDYGEPLRVDSLAGVVCHAGIFRSFGFRGLCDAPWNVGPGLGSMIDWDTADHMLKGSSYQPEPNTIRVNDCYTKEAAKNEISRILLKIQGK
jgi:hypothetical protein